MYAFDFLHKIFRSKCIILARNFRKTVDILNASKTVDILNA
jgi:hypothetical protein